MWQTGFVAISTMTGENPHHPPGPRGAAMSYQEARHNLLEQIERATRGFDSTSYGPVHDRVLRYCTGLVAGGTPLPGAMACAIRTVVLELLHHALSACRADAQQSLVQEDSFYSLPLEEEPATDWLKVC